MADSYRVGITNICQGAVVERFDSAFLAVLENIDDPNTAPKAKREITIKIVFEPTETRTVGVTSVDVATKLAPPRRMQTQLYFGEQNGVRTATEFNLNQPSIRELENDFNNAAPRDGKSAGAADR